MDERLVALLTSRPGHALCAACVARALGIPQKRAHELSLKLEADPRFTRRHAECSVCRKMRIVSMFRSRE